MLIEFGLNLFRSPDQDDPDAQVPRRFNGAFHFTCGSVIATHCVHSDLKHKGLELPIADCRLPIPDFDFATAYSPIASRQAVICSLSFFLCNDHATAIEPALRAHAVRQARLTTVRTVPGQNRRKMIVRPAFAGARLGMFAFWIWHYVLRVSPRTPDYQCSLDFNSPSAAHRSSARSSPQPHWPSFKFAPQSGHRPWHCSAQRRVIGNASSTCSRTTSSRSIVPP